MRPFIRLRRLVHSMLAEILDDVREVLRRRCQVEQPVALRAVLRIHLRQQLLQPFVTRVIIEVHLVIADPADKLIQLRIVRLHAAAGLDAFLHVGGKRLLQRTPRHPDDREVLRQIARLLQVVQRRQQLALGQVARRAEDHHHARVGAALRMLARLQLLGRDRHLRRRHKKSAPLLANAGCFLAEVLPGPLCDVRIETIRSLGQPRIRCSPARRSSLTPDRR